MPDTEKSALTRRRLLQNGMAITAGAIVLPEFFLHPSEAQTFREREPNPEQNMDHRQRTLARTLTCKSEGLYTEGFSDLVTGAKFIAPDKPRSTMTAEFSFDCNGRACYGASSEFELLGADESKIAGGSSLTIRLRHKELGLEVDAIYNSYDGHPAIRKHLVLRNSGASPLKFTHLNIESLGLALGPENEIILDAQYGAIPREIFYTGRSEDAGLLVVQQPLQPGRRDSSAKCRAI